MSGIQVNFQTSFPGFSLNVDIGIPHRGITAIFGHSGSGKTTLLRCIAGLEHAASGKLIINGEIWQDDRTYKPTHERSLGYVFQDASLLSHLSVIGNLNYGMKRVTNQRIGLDHAINLLGIEHLLNRKPDRLSGGEKSRVAIARALAVSPTILLMDEPLAALDVKRKREIMPYLERLHNELEIPILYVTHSPDEVARLADYLVVMEQGRVTASGKLTEVLSRMDLPIRLGEDAGVIVEATITEIDHQWHLAKVEFAGGSLWARDQALKLGSRVRVRILARDVSLATSTTEHSSIQNVLHGKIDAITEDDHPGSALVRVLVGDQPVIARLTRRAAHSMHLCIDQPVYVQIKSVALIS